MLIRSQIWWDMETIPISVKYLREKQEKHRLNSERKTKKKIKEKKKKKEVINVSVGEQDCAINTYIELIQSEYKTTARLKEEKNMKKKVVSSLLIMTMLTTVLAGCGSGSKDEGKKPQADSGETETIAIQQNSTRSQKKKSTAKWIFRICSSAIFRRQQV